MSTLAEDLPKAQARARELLAVYKSVSDWYGVMCIELALRNADNAIMDGDVIAMLRAVEELNSFKE